MVANYPWCFLFDFSFAPPPSLEQTRWFLCDGVRLPDGPGPEPGVRLRFGPDVGSLFFNNAHFPSNVAELKTHVRDLCRSAGGRAGRSGSQLVGFLQRSRDETEKISIRWFIYIHVSCSNILVLLEVNKLPVRFHRINSLVFIFISSFWCRK